jgi:hypothetical protein
MCCGTGSHLGSHSWGHHPVCSCGCGGPAHFGSCFPTKEEKIARMERYLEDLQEATRTMEGRIVALKEEE